MSTANSISKKVITTRILSEMKAQGEKIAMLTAYDYSTAKILDAAGMDIILVGDSASNVIAGNVTTLPITLDQMIYHASSVQKAVSRSLVVADLPFGTYQGDSLEALHSAIRMMKESGCGGIKIEGGEEIIESVKKIISAGIPVMGHLGLTPQSINKFGTYEVRAKEEAEAKAIEQKEIYDTAERAVQDTESLQKRLCEQYREIISWAELYENADLPTKKMIVNSLIRRVDVFQGYRLEIEFNFNLRQFFCGLDIELPCQVSA